MRYGGSHAAPWFSAQACSRAATVPAAGSCAANRSSVYAAAYEQKQALEAVKGGCREYSGSFCRAPPANATYRHHVKPAALRAEQTGGRRSASASRRKPADMVAMSWLARGAANGQRRFSLSPRESGQGSVQPRCVLNARSPGERRLNQTSE